MLGTRLLITISLLIIIGKAMPQTKGLESSEVKDPILSAKMLEDAPFMKPKISLQKALKLAETNLKKSIDLRFYFLQEAKLGYSKNEVIEPCWYFKWVKWGVKQSENVPVEIRVSMKGNVFHIQPVAK